MFKRLAIESGVFYENSLHFIIPERIADPKSNIAMQASWSSD
jgi:hypothetical protein